MSYFCAAHKVCNKCVHELFMYDAVRVYIGLHEKGASNAWAKKVKCRIVYSTCRLY